PLRRGARPHAPPLPVLTRRAPATTEAYTPSLHDALPICSSARVTRVAMTSRAVLAHPHLRRPPHPPPRMAARGGAGPLVSVPCRDRKSTRLTSRHVESSYAVLRLKKKTELLLGYPLHSLN